MIVRHGKTLDELTKLIDQTGAKAAYWSRRYEPAAIVCQDGVEAALRARGVTTGSFNSSLLFEPGSVATKSGTPYKVFTPFYRAALAMPQPERPLVAPRKSPRRLAGRNRCGSTSWNCSPRFVGTPAFTRPGSRAKRRGATGPSGFCTALC